MLTYSCEIKIQYFKSGLQKGKKNQINYIFYLNYFAVNSVLEIIHSINKSPVVQGQIAKSLLYKLPANIIC